MLNKLSYNLMNALNEAEEIEVKKTTYTTETYLNENCKEKLKESEDLGYLKQEAKEYMLKDLHEQGELASTWVDYYMEALEEDGVELSEEEYDELYNYLNDLYNSLQESENLTEEIESDEQKTELEERLASLKTQLEVDGAQLADDEKAAIQQEIADIEAELDGQEIDNKIMNESAPGTDAYDKLVQGDDVFFRDNAGHALLIHYADNYPEPEDYDEGYFTGWNKGEDAEYDKEQEEKFQKAKNASENREVWEVLEVNESTCEPTGEIYTYCYGQDELMDILADLRQVEKITKLEEGIVSDLKKNHLINKAAKIVDHRESAINKEQDIHKYDKLNKNLNSVWKKIDKISTKEEDKLNKKADKLNKKADKLQNKSDKLSAKASKTLDDASKVNSNTINKFQSKLKEAEDFDYSQFIELKDLGNTQQVLDKKAKDDKEFKDAGGAMVTNPNTKKDSLGEKHNKAMRAQQAIYELEDIDEEDVQLDSIINILDNYGFEYSLKVEDLSPVSIYRLVLYALNDIKNKDLNESEEVTSEFKVGDVVKVPYKYGAYTPGEFTEAPIIDIEDGKYVTVEVPSKQVVMMDQLKKWNTLGESEKLTEADGWIAFYNGNKVEITKDEAKDLWGAKQVAIKKLNVPKSKTSLVAVEPAYNESLTEEYSEKLGGDPEDFVSDVEIIKAKLMEIDTSKFGSHLAEQMVDDWVSTCNYQIEKGKRLASGDEFYTESEDTEEFKTKYAKSFNNWKKANPNSTDEEIVKILKAKQYNGELHESEESVGRKMTKEEFHKEFGKGCSVDVINAGREPEDRIEIIDECDTPIAEAEVKGLKEVKNQGNIYMLEDETNKFIVGENYNAEEGLIENAEIYESKEEADKDYLDRCEITGGQEEAEVVEKA